MAKALVGGMSLLLALNDGLLAVDDLAWHCIPQWAGDPVKSKITIRHLATHSSGIEDAEASEQERLAARQRGVSLTTEHMSLPGWKGGFWRQDPDPFTLARDQAPVIFTPGSQYAYSNPGMGMLSYAVTASLKASEFSDIRTLLRDRVMRPIGTADKDWSIGYGKTF
jgi:CubicO group peptidase (beta-lactamase class C family)